jgi:hypothetical protein
MIRIAMEYAFVTKQQIIIFDNLHKQLVIAKMLNWRVLEMSSYYL